MNYIVMHTHEIMPTQLRAQGAALDNSLGDACIVTSVSLEFDPYFCLFNFQSKVHEALPFLILGVGGIIAAIVSVNLPETAKEQLPKPVGAPTVPSAFIANSGE
jgi:hypothetical protein